MRFQERDSRIIATLHKYDGVLARRQLKEMFWPGGVQPGTYIPKFIIDSPVDIERQADKEIEVLDTPCQVKLQCPTEGASIAYTFEQGDHPHWLLYAGPLKLAPGEYTMRARAVRIGYKESGEVVQKFMVK